MGKKVQTFGEVLAQCGAYKLVSVQCRVDYHGTHTIDHVYISDRFDHYASALSKSSMLLLMMRAVKRIMRKLSNNKSSRENKRNCQKYENPCFHVSDA
jgi:hypothetical protein